MNDIRETILNTIKEVHPGYDKNEYNFFDPYNSIPPIEMLYILSSLEKELNIKIEDIFFQCDHNLMTFEGLSKKIEACI